MFDFIKDGPKALGMLANIKMIMLTKDLNSKKENIVSFYHNVAISFIVGLVFFNLLAFSFYLILLSQDKSIVLITSMGFAGVVTFFVLKKYFIASKEKLSLLLNFEDLEMKFSENLNSFLNEEEKVLSYEEKVNLVRLKINESFEDEIKKPKERTKFSEKISNVVSNDTTKDIVKSVIDEEHESKTKTGELIKKGIEIAEYHPKVKLATSASRWIVKVLGKKKNES